MLLIPYKLFYVHIFLFVCFSMTCRREAIVFYAKAPVFLRKSFWGKSKMEFLFPIMLFKFGLYSELKKPQKSFCLPAFFYPFGDTKRLCCNIESVVTVIKSAAFGRRGRVRGEHQVPPLAFNPPPAGDKLPKVLTDFGQFAGGCCILQHPPCCAYSVPRRIFSAQIFCSGSAGGTPGRGCCIPRTSYL